MLNSFVAAVCELGVINVGLCRQMRRVKMCFFDLEVIKIVVDTS